MNTAALLALIADLYAQVTALQEALAKEREPSEPSPPSSS